jgi:molybdopterin synthase sulfur carrier subunit
VIIRVYASLRQIVGAREVDVPAGEGSTVRDALLALVEKYPGLADSLWQGGDHLSGHVAVLLNGRDLRHLDGLDTRVEEGDILHIFPPVGGGTGDMEMIGSWLKEPELPPQG